jgi:hypothetical protein
MSYRCLGCGDTHQSKRGLNNHRRSCLGWKTLDGVATYKRRRVDMQTLGPNLGRNLQVPSETLGPGNPENLDLDLEVPEEIRVPAGSATQDAPEPPQTSTRSGRTVRFPRRFDDYLPGMRTEALAHIPSKETFNRNPPQSISDQLDALGMPSPTAGVEETSGSQATSTRNDSESPLDDLEGLRTDTDCFGVYRVYARKPLYSLSQFSSPDTHHVTQSGPPDLDTLTTPYYHPFSNPSAAAMMVIHHLGSSTLSLQRTSDIAHILGGLGSDLSLLDLTNFNAAVENRKLDAYLTSAPENMFQREDGWQESSVRIRLPLDKKKMPETQAAEFEVNEIFHRDIIDVVSSVYQSDAVRYFNHIPFKQFWKSSEHAPPERLYGEFFSSQAMLDADNEICKFCLENDLDHSDLEAVTVPILLYSDSTHLASFGTASCWPIYMFFGSQSKYVRARPTSSACHHIAYMPKVCHI